MNIPNEADQLRRQVMARIARAIVDDKLDAIDRIPLVLRPKGSAYSRCCIYKDRELIRQRCLAALGYRIEEITDEVRPLSDYARQACNRFYSGIKPTGPNLTIMSDSCSACLESQTVVTNLCRGCFARPCTTVCPKKAIVVQNGRAMIDQKSCVNCGLCTQACSFRAIVSLPLPCREPCPVDAVGKDENGHVIIDFERCINCGRCSNACPFSAIIEKSQMADILTAIKSKQHVIALPAPALAGIFPGELGQIHAALLKLGFDAVYDVSAGAELTSQNEAIELEERLAEGEPFMTTSCCPSWFLAVERVMPEMAPYVSHTPTPMQYTAEMARQDYPDAVVVFIGPCMAKRNEAQKDDRVDYVMTIDELAAIIMAAEIDLEFIEPAEASAMGKKTGRGFPLTGGVATAVTAYMTKPELAKSMTISGLDAKKLKLLRAYAKMGKAQGANLIEVMACSGGCIGGPCSFEKIDRAHKKITKQLDNLE